MKKYLLITISTLILLSINIPSVFAFTCESISTEKSDMFVILEEVLISKDQETANNKICFRECKTNVKEMRECKYVSDCKPDGTVTCTKVQVIAAESGTDLLTTYVGMIYRWAAGTIGIISVLIIVFSGVGIMTAGGDSGKIDTHKNHIMQSLAGLALLFLSGLILYTINPTFFV